MNQVDESAEASEDALLAEYGASQEHVRVIEAVIWQGTAIVIGGSIAAIAFLIGEPATRPVAIATTALAAGALLLIGFWWRVKERHIASQMATQRRMREIEHKAGMRRNIYLYLLANWSKHELLDEWRWLTCKEKESFVKDYLVRGRGLPWPSGGALSNAMYALVVVGSVLLAAGKWLEYLLYGGSCP
jgi:hypothetical protein